MKVLSYITGNERRGLAIVIVAIAVALVALFVANGDGKSKLAAGGNNDSVATRKLPVGNAEKAVGLPFDSVGRQAELFTFDPNTASATQLLRLGLQEWQVRSICKYRSKGGVFRRKTDFARVYGLTAGQYKRLEPYISIGRDYLPAAEVYGTAASNAILHDTLKHSSKLRQGEQIALNTADSTQLRLVPGIGAYFSRRIIDYRNRLGGFNSVRQLLEIENFPAESLPYFVLGDVQLRRVNLNKDTWAQLRRHPYIGYRLARSITEYRRLHGRINSVDDLRLCDGATPEALSKLESYVEY